MGVLRKLASQTIIYGTSSVLGRILNLVLAPLHTNSFAPAAYGVVTQLYSGVTFVNVVVTFGMETTFFRFLQDSDTPQKIYRQAFYWVMLMAAVVGGLIAMLRGTLAGFIDHSGAETMLLILAGIIFLDALAALPMARLRHEEKAVRFAAINLVNVVVNVAANFIFILVLKKGIEYIFLANLIASTVRTTLALWGQLPLPAMPDRRLLNEMVHYGLYIMLAGFAGTMNETFDRLMIPELWGEAPKMFNGLLRTGQEMNGLYGANYKVAMLVVLFTQAFRYAAEPFFFRTAKEKNSPQTFARVFHYFTLSTLAGFLIIASFSREIVSFNFFGYGTFIDQRYWEALEVVPILLLAYVFSAAYLNISIWFKITKQTRFALLFTGTGAVITILVNLLTVPRMGYMGSAWATLICYAVMATMVYLLGQKYYPIPYRVSRLLLYSGIFVAAWFINDQIGPTAGYWPAFVAKAGVCLITLVGIAAVERFGPAFSSDK